MQDRTHTKTKNITNSSAKNTHQNTDTCKGIVIGAGNDRRRSGTADIGDRCRRDHAKIPVEELGEDVHTDNVDCKNEHAVNDPHRSFDQRIERSLRSEQGDDGVQQDAGKLFNSRKLPSGVIAQTRPRTVTNSVVQVPLSNMSRPIALRPSFMTRPIF